MPLLSLLSFRIHFFELIRLQISQLKAFNYKMKVGNFYEIA